MLIKVIILFVLVAGIVVLGLYLGGVFGQAKGQTQTPSPTGISRANINLNNFEKKVYSQHGEDSINLNNFEKKVYSQNGEDGITEKLIDLVYGKNKNNKYYVEFGVQDGKECNTRYIMEKYNWKGLLMDGSNENQRLNLQKEFITKENIISLFHKYKVPENINLLSVDIDYNDFYVLNQILKKYTCDIVICEYNATHLPNEDKVIIYDKDGMWDTTNYFGGALLSFQRLLNTFNYDLVYCDKSGTNAFFINKNIIKKNDLHFQDINDINKLYRYPTYGDGPNGGHKHDSKNRKYLNSELIIDK